MASPRLGLVVDDKLSDLLLSWHVLLYTHNINNSYTVVISLSLQIHVHVDYLIFYSLSQQIWSSVPCDDNSL